MPKLALAPVEEPPYLTVGTDVSAKYKGAFCEAKIIDVNKHVKLRVLFDGGSGTHLIDDTDIKTGSTLETGTKIEAKHPEKKQNFVQATITKILDHSRYTVIFDDGDQCILRRNSLCLKSGKHFAESETLDRLPLTNPEHFGNPVKVESSIGTAPANNSKSHNDKLKGEPSAQVNIEINNVEPSNTETSTKCKKQSMEVGARLMVQYSKGKVQNVYEAKVLKIDTNSAGKTRYFVHYLGWNNRYDEWITRGRILNVVSDKADVVPKSASKGQAEATNPAPTTVAEPPKTAASKPATTPTNSNHSSATPTLSTSSLSNFATTSSDQSTSSPIVVTSTIVPTTVLNVTPALKLVNKEKDAPTKTRRSRLSDKSVSRPIDPPPEVSSTPAIATTASSNPITVSASSSSLSVASSTPSTSSTIGILSSPPREKEKLAKSRRSKNSATLERKASVSSQNAVIPPAIIEQVEDDSAKEKPATPKTRRSARPTRKKEIKDSQQCSSAQATSSSDDDAKKSINSTNNNSASSSAGSLDESSLDNNSQPSNSAEQCCATEPAEEKILPQTIEPVEATCQQVLTVADVGHVDSPPQEAQAPKTLIDNLECMPEPTIQAQPVETPVKEVEMEAVEPIISSVADKTEDLEMVPSPSTRPDEPNNASPSSRPIYRFCEEIDESDCDKKISILQERIMALRQTYIALKTELVDLDRRRKRPRTERSNSEHMNCGLVCRN